MRLIDADALKLTGDISEIVEEIMDAPTVDQWIPVSERLPKQEDADRGLCVLWWNKSLGCAERVPWGWKSSSFTHWMPLPAAPRK
jgi:hypothetical protein